MSKDPSEKIDQEVDELVEKLSEEDQELLDQALANLVGFIEQETTLGFWETEEEEEVEES